MRKQTWRTFWILKDGKLHWTDCDCELQALLMHIVAKADGAVRTWYGLFTK